MKSVKKLFRILAIVLTLVLFLGWSQRYVFRVLNKEDLRMNGFYLEEKDSLDVLFLGASEVYSGYSPAVLYDKSGLTSYPYTAPGCPVTLWKTMLEDALRRQSPSLVVVDISGACYLTPGRLYQPAAFHYVLDGMPLSCVKLDAVFHVARQVEDSQWSFLFPIIKYHENWKQSEGLVSMMNMMRSTRLMEKRGYAVLRGISTMAQSKPVKAPVRDLLGDKSELPMAEDAEQSLREFLEYCREKDVQVLFARFPHRVEDAADYYQVFQILNTAERIIREDGFPVLNMEILTEELGLDVEKDFSHPNHLNIYGQQKVSAYLAEFLTKECGVVPRPQSDEQKAEWANSVEYYKLYCLYIQQHYSANASATTTIAENWWLMEALEKLKNNAA